MNSTKQNSTKKKRMTEDTEKHNVRSRIPFVKVLCFTDRKGVHALTIQASVDGCIVVLSPLQFINWLKRRRQKRDIRQLYMYKNARSQPMLALRRTWPRKRKFVMFLYLRKGECAQRYQSVRLQQKVISSHSRKRM